MHEPIRLFTNIPTYDFLTLQSSHYLKVSWSLNLQIKSLWIAILQIMQLNKNQQEEIVCRTTYW